MSEDQVKTLTDSSFFRQEWLIDAYDLVHWGGFSYESVRCMPIRYRTFFVERLRKEAKERNSTEKSSEDTIGQTAVNSLPTSIRRFV